MGAFFICTHMFTYSLTFTGNNSVVYTLHVIVNHPPFHKVLVRLEKHVQIYWGFYEGSRKHIEHGHFPIMFENTTTPIL